MSKCLVIRHTELGFWLFASARMLLMKRKSNVTHAGVGTQDIYHLVPKKCRGGAGSSVRPPRIFATFPLTPRVMLAGEKRHHVLAQGWRERAPLPGMVSPEREASPRRLPAEVCPRNIPEVAPGWGSREPDCFPLVWRGGCQGVYHSALHSAVGYLTCWQSQVFICKTVGLRSQRDEDWLCLINGDSLYWLSLLVGGRGTRCRSLSSPTWDLACFLLFLHCPALQQW